MIYLRSIGRIRESIKQGLKQINIDFPHSENFRQEDMMFRSHVLRETDSGKIHGDFILERVCSPDGRHYQVVAPGWDCPAEFDILDDAVACIKQAFKDKMLRHA